MRWDVAEPLDVGGFVVGVGLGDGEGHHDAHVANLCGSHLDPLRAKGARELNGRCSVPAHKRAVDPLGNLCRCPGPGPIVDERVRIIFRVVVRQTRGESDGDCVSCHDWSDLEAGCPAVRTSGSALVLLMLRTDLPIHVHSLPGAWAYQHDRNRGVSECTRRESSVAPLPSSVQCVIDVPCIDRPVHDALSRHADEIFLVIDVLFVKADEHLMLGDWCHGKSFLCASICRTIDWRPPNGQARTRQLLSSPPAWGRTARWRRTSGLAAKYLGLRSRDGATRYRSAGGGPSPFNFRTKALYDSRQALSNAR